MGHKRPVVIHSVISGSVSTDSHLACMLNQWYRTKLWYHFHDIMPCTHGTELYCLFEHRKWVETRSFFIWNLCKWIIVHHDFNENKQNGTIKSFNHNSIRTNSFVHLFCATTKYFRQVHCILVAQKTTIQLFNKNSVCAVSFCICPIAAKTDVPKHDLDQNSLQK